MGDHHAGQALEVGIGVVQSSQGGTFKSSHGRGARAEEVMFMLCSVVPKLV